jgi:hypothetical protein
MIRRLVDLEHADRGYCNPAGQYNISDCELRILKNTLRFRSITRFGAARHKDGKYDSRFKNHYFYLCACAGLLPLQRQFRLQLRGKRAAMPGILASRCSLRHENMMSIVKTDEYGRFSFDAYEGVKYSARVIIDLGDSEYAYFKLSDVPADTEKAPMKIVIDPTHPESKAKLK